MNDVPPVNNYSFIKSNPTSYRHDVYLDGDVEQPSMYRDFNYGLTNYAPPGCASVVSVIFILILFK